MTRKTKVLPKYVESAYVEMHTEDIDELGVENGEMVRKSIALSVTNDKP